MTKIGIVGGAGFTAGELIRLLIHHPRAELSCVVSESQSSLPITAVHKDLLGQSDLLFEKNLHPDVEIIFLCMGHGMSINYMHSHPHLLNKRIIDLSTDYRSIKNESNFIYGLPELNRSKIQLSSKVANPGCFATAIELALLPLAHEGKLRDSIHINGITGSTGAGQSLSPTTHFSWRTNNASIYKLFTHQHLTEIKESIHQLQPKFNGDLLFVPHRGNFTRGIFISAYMRSELSHPEAEDIYRQYYKDHPFTHISDSDISLKEVINTNKCHIKIAKHNDLLHITSIVDNLLKGASGQAIQNMNLMMGWKEDLGLQLKSIAF